MAKKYFKEYNQGIPAICFEEDQPEGFLPITDYDERLKLHTGRYFRLQEDGVAYFHEFQAKMYINILDGVYTAEDVVVLQSHLKQISDEIKEGSWLTAQISLPNIALSGIFDQAMKDEIQADIDQYVLDNY